MAIDHKFSNTGASSILELLQGNVRLQVPKFQRNYAWNIDKVETLWNDVMEHFMLYKKNPEYVHDAQYLLGPVVLVKNKGQSEFFVIDGQQRLATLTILFCVTRDIIYEYYDYDSNNILPGIDKIRGMIENITMAKHTSWKLVLNDTDKELFEEIQKYEENDEPQIKRLKNKKNIHKTKSEKLLKANYIFLYEKIMDALTTEFDSDKSPHDIKQNKTKDELKELRKNNIPMLNFFLNYVQQFNYVVKIMVSDDSTAFQIFETLNARGQGLSKSNLVKNHILNQINKSDDKFLQKLSDQWNNIFDDIIGQQGDDDFIFESLRSRLPKPKYYSNPTTQKKFPKISMTNLYDIIKLEKDDHDKCKEYVQNLEKDAEFISNLNDPSTYPVNNAQKDEDVKNDIYALKALDAKFIRTPILAAFREWGRDSDDYRKLVKLLVLFFFKYRVVQQEHPGKVEEVILDITEMILDGKPLEDIIKRMKEKDDHEYFKQQFKRFILDPQKNAAKYALQKISLFLYESNTDVKPLDGLTLEHVLPQKFQQWNENDFFEDGPTDSDNNMKDYVPSLGNLTLLKDAINTKIKNSVFEKKKEEGYSKSNLNINKDTVCNHKKWNARTIKEREKQFAEYADKIWDLSSY